MKSAGERIKELRKERGWTQFQLAEKTGISLASIKLYESGKGIPSERSNGTLETLATTFGVFPEWILNGEGEKSSLKGLKAFRLKFNEYVYPQRIWSDIRYLYDIEDIPIKYDSENNNWVNANTLEELSHEEAQELLEQTKALEALKNSIFNTIEARVAQYKKQYGGK